MKNTKVKCDHSGKGSNKCFYVSHPYKKCHHAGKHILHEFSECNVIAECFQMDEPVACIEVK